MLSFSCLIMFLLRNQSKELLFAGRLPNSRVGVAPVSVCRSRAATALCEWEYFKMSKGRPLCDPAFEEVNGSGRAMRCWQLGGEWGEGQCLLRSSGRSKARSDPKCGAVPEPGSMGRGAGNTELSFPGGSVSKVSLAQCWWEASCQRQMRVTADRNKASF